MRRRDLRTSLREHFKTINECAVVFERVLNGLPLASSVSIGEDSVSADAKGQAESSPRCSGRT
jgi:hypothetical protein